MMARRFAALALVIFAFCAPTRAERARIGVLQTAGAGPMYIALAKGYFAREGLQAEIVPFVTAQPMAVSIATGELDFGATALGAPFYNLASQGLLRIIGAQGREVPNFPNNGLVATVAAWENGLRDFKDVKGRVVAVAAKGSGPHYCLGLIADHYGFSTDDVDMQFLNGSPNMIAALVSGRVEAAIMPSAAALAAVRDAPGKLIGWIGDMQAWQLGGAFTSAKHADEHQDYVDRFLRAYKSGVHDYYDAFITPEGKRQDGPTADAMLAIMSKGIDQPVELLRQAITYTDRDVRLDGKDIYRQVAWHQKHGLIEHEVDVDKLLDKRYAQFLPE